MASSTGIQPPVDLLQLPTHYGVRVEDVVYFKRDWRASDERIIIGEPARTGAGSVLVAKICDALGRRGYEDSVVQKVAGLVVANLMTCASTQVGEEAGLETVITKPDDEDGRKDVPRKVYLMLRGMLDDSATRTRSVNMNSNEPVLLINGCDGIEIRRLVASVSETVRQLQEDWEIWPARVYAGRYFPGRGDGFSITLLNVVNTDIGGPSMVQLLDEHSDSPEWGTFLRREVWRHMELLWVEKGDLDSSEADDDVTDDESVHSIQSRDSIAGDAVIRLIIEKSPRVPHSPKLTAENSTVEEKALESPLNLDEKASDDGMEPVGDSDDDSAFADFEQEKSSQIVEKQATPEPERNIVHPTWERRHDGYSLIDLIRSQALEIPPLGADEETRVESLDAAASEPIPSESPPSELPKDDDSFVLL